MQYNIDVIRRLVRRYVLQTEVQSGSLEIYNQRPIQIAVAISSHDRDSRPDGTKFINNGFSANVAQVPDFICAPGDFFHPFWQTIMRVGEHENAARLIL
jgi:hypothetical protein